MAIPSFPIYFPIIDMGNRKWKGKGIEKTRHKGMGKAHSSLRVFPYPFPVSLSLYPFSLFISFLSLRSLQSIQEIGIRE